jgi:hypothetical protein
MQVREPAGPDAAGDAGQSDLLALDDLVSDCNIHSIQVCIERPVRLSVRPDESDDDGEIGAGLVVSRKQAKVFSPANTISPPMTANSGVFSGSSQSMPACPS